MVIFILTQFDTLILVLDARDNSAKARNLYSKQLIVIANFVKIQLIFTNISIRRNYSWK